MDRRNFISAAAGAAVGFIGLAEADAAAAQGPLIKIPRPSLPFSKDALAPVISEKQLALHFNAHHMGYFDRLLTLLPAAGMSELTVEEVIAQTRGKADQASIYNAAGQLFAHNLYWSSLAPALAATEDRSPAQLQSARAEEVMSAALRRRVARDFGSLNGLTKAMADAAGRHFSNGWVWLVRRAGGELAVYSTPNAQTPLDQGDKPLLAIDIWEHAYYLDYMAKKGDHVSAVLSNILNWRTATAGYEA